MGRSHHHQPEGHESENGLRDKGDGTGGPLGFDGGCSSKNVFSGWEHQTPGWFFTWHSQHPVPGPAWALCFLRVRNPRQPVTRAKLARVRCVPKHSRRPRLSQFCSPPTVRRPRDGRSGGAKRTDRRSFNWKPRRQSGGRAGEQQHDAFLHARCRRGRLSGAFGGAKTSRCFVWGGLTSKPAGCV